MGFFVRPSGNGASNVSFFSGRTVRDSATSVEERTTAQRRGATLRACRYRGRRRQPGLHGRLSCRHTDPSRYLSGSNPCRPYLGKSWHPTCTYCAYVDLSRRVRRCLIVRTLKPMLSRQVSWSFSLGLAHQLSTLYDRTRRTHPPRKNIPENGMPAYALPTDRARDDQGCDALVRPFADRQTDKQSLIVSASDDRLGSKMRKLSTSKSSLLYSTLRPSTRCAGTSLTSQKLTKLIRFEQAK